MPKAKNEDSQDYQTLSLELDAVLTQLQQPDVQVDDAVKLYERGLQLVQQLEAFVASAENKLESLRLQAATDTEK